MGADTDPKNVLAVAIVFLILCPVVVALRFAARIHQKGKVGADDWLVLAALLMVIGCAVDLIVGVSLGVFGFKTPPPPDPSDPDDAMNYNFTVVEKLEWAFFLMQIVSMGLIKLSLIFFLRRIFVTGHKRNAFNYVSMAMVITVALWATAFFLWFLLSCGNRFTARWTTVNSLHRTCPTDIESDLALAISDFLTDVFIMFLPIPVVLRLHMKASRKIAVIGVFALGTVALVASIVRLALFVYITGVASGRISDPGADNNLLTTESLYWSMLESGLALIACCLPALQSVARLPLIQSVFDSMRRFSSVGSYGSRPQSHDRNRNGQPGYLKERQSNESGHELDPTASAMHFVPNHADIGFETTATTGSRPRSLENGLEEGHTGILVERTVDLVHAR